MLKDMTAVVTGGSRGIGRAIVERLCRDGADVVFNYASNEESANDVVRTVRADGGKVRAIRLDFREPGAPEQLMEAAEAHLGDLHILVNNAAMSFSPAPMAETETELFDRVHATGYTIIGNISGKGHHGVREAHFMFSDQESLVMIMTVVPEEKVEPILAGLKPLFSRHSGVLFVADVSVSRREYFGEQTP